MDGRTSNGGVAVIILTSNEEANLPQALDSVVGWARETFILDSMSTDNTAEVARRYGCHVALHAFENYSKQRNYALDHLPIASEWVLFLDADEWIPEPLQKEISALIATSPIENGFYINRRLIWMGTWIRRGYYPTWILRLFRHGRGRCEERAVNEHILVEGATARLSSDLVHEDRKGVTDWIAKHNRYATLEAFELLNARVTPGDKDLNARLLASQAQRKRWVRQRVWNRLPPLIRPFIYFIWRYVLAGGYLDGTSAFMYHVLQGFWFPMLIDIKYIELKTNLDTSKSRDRRNELRTAGMNARNDSVTRKLGC
jgi:glycosyltransferase involved in cell wall biosynthesis